MGCSSLAVFAPIWGYVLVIRDWNFPFCYIRKISMLIYFWHLVIFDLYCYFVAHDHGVGNLSAAQYFGYFLLLLIWCGVSNTKSAYKH